MRFPRPLMAGRLVRRYKRFLADVELDTGESVTAHCANPGSMLGLAAPGMRVWLSRSDDPKRKLAYSWELVEVDGALVGINTAWPNGLVEAAVREGTIGELAGYAALRREVKYGRNSRIDLLLEDEARGRAYVEVKNVHLLRRAGLAEFPDSVTARGAKHLDELADQVAEGHRAMMVYLIQRPDADSFALAADIDPTYARAFDRAAARGVEAVAYACRITPEEIVVERKVPMA
ncbi:DNA/RNA nuclease SfsA [Prosthecodimorpha staleyi]|uniref:Sugar fermentation stimulation protein homolog n=1 Tax=Prosthecodimorpha staleyi TaxID=2840188 RepID=A0A947GF15_9HYPH|nr:DNA/RNA nuclease SfsA [Prosthecodimorpha staleyi]MBT9292176.1 DNA/RNA nuclease SfsA [Prosthecodimorpha staleyi]